MPEAPVPTLPKTPSVPGRGRDRNRISVVWALVANFGGLLVIAILAVFGFSIWSASENTIDLLRQRAEQTVTLLEQRLRDHLDQPAVQLEQMAELIAAGQVSPENQAAFDVFLAGAISGSAHLRGLTYFSSNLNVRSAQRVGGKIVLMTGTADADARITAMIRAAFAGRAPAWIAPLYVPIIGQTVIGRGQPVIRDGQVIGVLVAVISTEELSTYLGRIGREVHGTAFILYGRDHVLAHMRMATDRMRPSAAEPLPPLTRFGDKVLASLWDERFRGRGRLFVTRPPIQNRTIRIDGEVYPFAYTELAGYSDRPLIVGAYARFGDFEEVFMRLLRAAGAGLLAIVVAILMAVLIGRRLARPVKRISEAASLVGELRVAEVQPLPRSRIREIDEQARAFNSMTGALRWFEAYVPKSLARHLLKAGDMRAVASEQRHLTVMFTDIVGFSTSSEKQDAAAVAEYLNDHFGLVNNCIEAEGGVVDKYIGDCVMAFWGAPEKLKNRAERACRAALAIRAAVERDNAECRARGKPETRMRIGIHSGDATVGNIGSAGRVNYTIIGDMVNVGQRIEQLGKVLGPKDIAVAILISESTRADLGPDFHPRSLGCHKLKGRAGDMEIFAL